MSKPIVPFCCCIAAVSLIACIALPTAGSAQTDARYPTRTVTMVVPFAAGGASDVLMRVVAQQLGRELGTTFIVENRPGANGNLGMAYVASAVPDGYTIGVSATATLSTNPAIYKKLPYDPTTFVAIAPVGANTSALVISPKVPAHSVSELVTLMKPGTQHFSYGSAGVGNPNHLAGELFKRSAKVEMTHVPYRGGGEIMRDLIGGQIQLAFSPLIESLPHIKSGSIRALGVARPQRNPHLPDVPTITEAGVPGVEYASWQGLSGPKGMPRHIVSILNNAVKSILTKPEMRDALNKLVIDPMIMTPEEFEAFVVAERKKWAEVAQLAGVRLD